MAFPTPKPHPLGMRRLACLLLLTACGGKPSPEKTAPVGPPRAAPALRPIDRTLHALSVNGTRLTYRINGDSGATVVFIHGTFGDLNAWGGQEGLFAQGYRVQVLVDAARRAHASGCWVDIAPPAREAHS